MRKLNLRKALLPIVLVVISIIIINKCSFHSLPKEKLQTVIVDIKETFADNEYQLFIKNPVYCPTRFFLSSKDKQVDELLNKISPVVIESKTDTTIIIKDEGNLKGKIAINFKWGDPELDVRSNKITSLPYPNGKSYNLLQGNNSNPTHNSDMSRYAFDFTMNTGDTITSAQNGYVVMVVDGYTGWGYSDKWKSFVNQVMIYDTASNLFTMYGHLKQYGSLVEVGDYVNLGQPIALSGKTGQTQEEHLHFNVLQADTGKGGLKSYPLDSIGSYKVKELKRYQAMNAMAVSNNNLQ